MRFWRGHDMCELIHRHRRPILVVAALATALGAYLTSRLSLESDLSALLPDGFESVQALERVREEVGGIGVLRVVLASSDFPALLRFAEDLEPRLEANEFVREVEYRNDVAFYESHALLYLDTLQLDSLRVAIENEIEAGKQEINPFIVEDLFGEEEEEPGAGLEDWETRYRELLPRPYFTNEDSTVLVLQVFPSQPDANLDFSRRMRDEITSIVAGLGPESYAPDMEVRYGGNIQNRIVEYETLKHDILGTAVYGVGAVFALIALYFRSLVVAALIASSLVAALAWTFGVTALAIGQLNTITGFLFVILFGLGIDYGIHAFARYREGRRAGRDPAGALHEMVCETGGALATTAFTTSAAFYSLMLMDFRGFSELGFIAGTGLLFSLVAMVAVLPALTVVAERMGVLRFPTNLEPAATLERRPLRHARSTLIAGGLMLLVAIYGTTRVDFEYDFTNLRVITEERQDVSEKTEGVFTLSESPAIVLADTPEEMQEIVAAVRARIRTDSLTPTVDEVRSILDVVPPDQAKRLQRIREIRRLVEDELGDVANPDTRRRVEDLRRYLAVDAPFAPGDLPESERRRFLNKRGEVGNFVLIYPGVPLRDGRNAMAFRDDVGTIVTPSGRTYHAASANIIMAEMLSILTREGRIAILLSLVVVYGIVSFQFRSLARGALVMTPLLAGMIGMGGLMWAFGMKLNLFNIVVLPSIVGIGVDSGVHLYHRYRVEGPGSLPVVIHRTGLAVGMATATTIVGFSGLLVATHPGLVSIGKLAVVGLSAILVSSLWLFPALLQVLEDRGRELAAAPAGSGADGTVTEERDSNVSEGGAPGGHPRPIHSHGETP